MKYSLLFLIFCLCLFACRNSGQESDFSIGFNADSTEIGVSGIPYADLQEFSKAAGADSTVTRGLIFITEVPPQDDTATYERPVSGKILIGEGRISFRPDTAFVKGKNYLVESYIGAIFGKQVEAFGKKLRPGVRPQSVILNR